MIQEKYNFKKTVKHGPSYQDILAKNGIKLVPLNSENFSYTKVVRPVAKLDTLAWLKSKIKS